MPNQLDTESVQQLECEYWRDAIGEELSKKEAEEFLALVRDAVQSSKTVPHIGARMTLWQFESRPFGLKYLRAVQKDKELMDLCEEVVSLYRREIMGEMIPPQLFQDLHTKIGTAWDVIGWRERERRMTLARKWAWLGARKWAWLGMRPWSNTWIWAMTATRNRNYAQAIALIRLWAEVRIVAKKEIGKKKRMSTLQSYFLRLIYTP